MPFNNPIVGALKLIRDAIQSPNFVTGVSGWSINKNGTAEFRSVTAGGSFTSTDGTGTATLSGHSLDLTNTTNVPNGSGHIAALAGPLNAGLDLTANNGTVTVELQMRCGDGTIDVSHPIQLDQSWTSLVASYPAGWATTAGFPDLAYRMDPTGRVWFRGNVQVGAANAVGVKFTMPLGYRPAVRTEILVPTSAAGASDFTPLKRFDVSTAGAFNMLVVTGGAATNFEWAGVSYSTI